MNKPIRVSFRGANGAELAARLDLPTGAPKAFALFAHCFTCSKDLIGSRTVSTALTRAGVAVLRFDFTGLGGSGGDFASTNFTMNLGDLEAAARFLEQNYEAPSLLVGHSLGGAAVIAVAGKIPSVKAVATINAPADVQHITGKFGDRLEEIRQKGSAEVELAERSFVIERQFLEDLDQHDIEASAGRLQKPLLIVHSPVDEIVGIENATRLFVAARHPKSFISLDNADHLLTDSRDATYAAEVVAAWATRYIDLAPERAEGAKDESLGVEVRETAQGKFQALARVGPHILIADEPTSVEGGLGTGPSPYEYLSVALASCTSMTIRMYADFKKLPLDRVAVEVSHEKTHAAEIGSSIEGEAPIDHFTRKVELEGDLTPEMRQKMMQIADRCPVHRTMERGAHISTEERTNEG